MYQHIGKICFCSLGQKDIKFKLCVLITTRQDCSGYNTENKSCTYCIPVELMKRE